MLFNDTNFIFIFLPLVFILYYFLNSFRLIYLSKIWLIVASLYFYAYWNISYLPLIFISMLFNYNFGLFLRRTTQSARKKRILIFAITTNVLALCYYKYVDFFITNLNLIFSWHLPTIQPVLPLAISFYTFQQIAYLVDNYKNQIHESSVIDYFLFITFFPHLIAGPITHHKEMMSQFSSKRVTFFDFNNSTLAMFIFSIGLFKKLYIADSFAVWGNMGFDNVQHLHFIDAWLTSLSYSFQLYFDFSGYSDMAIGAALLFNIRLPVNFNSPYKAINIQDFWRRWHITLSRWLRDYIYIPLGGNRFGSFRTYFNLFLTFLIGGIWHGANWTFIVWGAMHGVALLVHRIWQSYNFKAPIPLAWLLTFLFVNAAWVVFRANDINSALHILKVMFYHPDLTEGVFHVNWQLSDVMASFYNLLQPNVLLHIILFSVVSFCGVNSMQIGGLIKYSGKYQFANTMMFLVLLSFFTSINLYYLLVSSGEIEFLYFNF